MKKNGRVFIKSFRALILLLMPLILLMAGSSYGATVNVYLQAGVTTIPAGAYSAVPLVPDEAITMWGYAQCTDATFVTCGPVTVPGPVLTATEGDTINITLRNNLPAPGPGAFSEPTSVVIPGQVPSAMNPVWINSSGTVVSTGSRLPGDTTSRVRSFNTETPVGETWTYSWIGLKPGTLLYESGTHQAVQVQMGLYGPLTVYAATAGQAYDDPSTAYTLEGILLYSEIDPELHFSVVSGRYGTPQPDPNNPVRGYMTSTVNYLPKYFLINGKPYTPGAPPLLAGIPGQKTLIRFLNAGLLEKTPTVNNNYMTLIAEDANLLPYSKEQYSLLLPAGKTMDVLLTPTTGGTIAIYDRSLNLTNAGVSPGGLLTYLQAASAISGTLGITTASPPAIAWDSTNSKFFVAVRGINNRIYLSTMTSAGVFNNDWTVLPIGTTNASPAIAWEPTNGGLLHIVVKGSNSSNLFAATVDGTMGAFSGFTQIPGATSSAPAIAWNPTNSKLEIVVKGANTNNIFGATVNFDLTGFSGYTQLPGATPSSPAIAWNPTDNKLEIVVRGNASTIFGATVDYDMTGFSGYTQIPGTTPVAPAISWNSTDGKLYIAIHVGASQIFAGTVDAAIGAFSGWTELPIGSPSSPGIAWNPVSNLMAIAIRAADNSIYAWPGLY